MVCGCENALGKLMDNLFLFLEDAAIPPTNNSSEQAIRMSVIFRRVTNCFRSEWGEIYLRRFVQLSILVKGRA